MEDDEECIHGLGMVSACVICNGRAAKEAKQISYREFPARYPGWCGECNLPIYPGQMISWAENIPVVHASCRL